MDLYRPICRHLVVPLWAAWEHSPYPRYLKDLQESQWWPPEQAAKVQGERLRRVLRHAADGSPFWRERLAAAGIVPEQVGSAADIAGLPILTKQEIRDNRERMLTGVPRYRRYVTSGSTGKPLSGWWDKETAEFKRAAKLRSETWTGWRLGDPVYLLYGNPEEEKRGIRRLRSLARRRLLERIEIMDMLRVTDEIMTRFVEVMYRRSPGLLWGHTHGLYKLAKFVQERDYRNIPLKGIFSAGMPLYQKERETIERAFGVPALNRYGCEELGLIAAECTERKGLHINTDGLLVEFLDRQGRPAAPGQPAIPVITDLHNVAMPMIRYQLEDVVVPGAGVCPCGRSQPLIESIQGRTADFLYTTRGEAVSGVSLTDHFTCQLEGVSQVQIIQTEPRLLRLRVVTDPDWGEGSQRRMRELIDHFFGADMRHEVEIVPEIPPEATGKYRFTICEIPAPVSSRAGSAAAAGPAGDG